MLDVIIPSVISDEEWDSLDNTVSYPSFGQSSNELEEENSHDIRRKYRRFTVHGRAILMHGNPLVGSNLMSGVQLDQFSAAGVAFYSPVQLLPKEQVELHTGHSDKIELHVARCQRVGEKRYQCGTSYAEGPLNPGKFRQLIDSLRAE